MAEETGDKRLETGDGGDRDRGIERKGYGRVKRGSARMKRQKRESERQRGDINERFTLHLSRNAVRDELHADT